jgi:hypothetical protein
MGGIMQAAKFIHFKTNLFISLKETSIRLGLRSLGNFERSIWDKILFKTW